MWLDIADEEGMLIQYEPTRFGDIMNQWDINEMIKEYGRWMRDNWNHPCVFMWDASNETVCARVGQDRQGRSVSRFVRSCVGQQLESSGRSQ